MFSNKNWGRGTKSSFLRWLLVSNWASVWLQEDMSDCLCMIYPRPLLLPPNKWYLSWPTSSLAFILPVLSCSPSGPTAVWMLGCWPWWTHHSAGSLWPQHNLLVSLLWWNIASPLAKTQVLESLIFFLFPLLLTNKLRLSELESQKGWSWKGLSKSSCPKPIERPVLNCFHSHEYQPNAAQLKKIVRIYY